MRSRRSIEKTQVEEDKPLQEGILTTSQIVFERKPYCHEISCPIHAMCIELYPATCRCDHNYVMSRRIRECRTGRRIISVRNLHVNIEFLSWRLHDMESTNFLRLALDVEQQLFIALRLDQDVFEGILLFIHHYLT